MPCLCSRKLHEGRGLHEGEMCTYEAKRPEDGAVQDQPGLLSKTSDLLLLADAHVLGERSQGILHCRRSQAGEKDNDERDEVGVVEASAIFSRLRIVVLKTNELGRVRL